jgi:hypothetical protein
MFGKRRRFCAPCRSSLGCILTTQKITFGEMRPYIRGLLIYCSDYRCSHGTAISADQWPDDVRLSDIEPRFTCQACGQRGADVRPDWASAEAMKLPAAEQKRKLTRDGLDFTANPGATGKMAWYGRARIAGVVLMILIGRFTCYDAPSDMLQVVLGQFDEVSRIHVSLP